MEIIGICFHVWKLGSHCRLETEKQEEKWPLYIDILGIFTSLYGKDYRY